MMKLATAFCDAIHDRAARRRRQIIDAARMLFIQKGFHATGVAQIAQRSGVAVGQLYRDFADKEAIVAAIVEGDCTKFLGRESLRQAIEADDSVAVWEWIAQFVEPADTESGAAAMFAEIAAECGRNDRIATIFARTHAEADANLRAAFALLAPGDHLADRRCLLADLVMTQSFGLKQHLLLRPDLDTAPLVASILALIRREIDKMRSDPVRIGQAA